MGMGIGPAHVIIDLEPRPQQQASLQSTKEKLTCKEKTRVAVLLLLGLAMLGAGLALTFSPVDFGTPGLPLMIISALFLLPAAYYTVTAFRKCCRRAPRCGAASIPHAPPASSDAVPGFAPGKP